MWIAHSLAALPTVVIGLTLYLLLSASGPLGWTHLLYRRTAMTLARFVLALPLVIAVVLGALRPTAGEALSVHGVTRARRMAWLLREVRPAVVSSTFLAFSRAFTELGAAPIVGGNIRGATRTDVLPVVEAFGLSTLLNRKARHFRTDSSGGWRSRERPWGIRRCSWSMNLREDSMMRRSRRGGVCHARGTGRRTGAGCRGSSSVGPHGCPHERNSPVEAPCVTVRPQFEA
jgi:hypothetical protein